MTSLKPSLGYVGVGLMGGPMVQRLVSLGYAVRAFDADPARLAFAEASGAEAAGTAAEAAAAGEIVILNLPSAEAVDAAVFGETGAARGIAATGLVLDLSTIPASVCRINAEKLRSEVGAGWIDAPVSGGPLASESGTLTIMAGGADADVARAMPLMNDIGRHFTHVGPTGSGCVVKTIAQLVVGSTYAVLAEAVRLAEAAGIDAAILPSCVSQGHADSQLMQQLYPRIAAHDFVPRSYARQLLKDLEMVQDLARDTGAMVPMSAEATRLYRRLIAAGRGEMDSGALYTLLAGSRAS